MEVWSVATRLVVVAEAHEGLITAARRMWAHEIGALPVLDGGGLVGILTERDLVAAMAVGSGHDSAVAAHMTPKPATATPREDSVAVARRMLELGVRHMPVVDAGGVVGMVSATDLLTVVAWPKADSELPAWAESTPSRPSSLEPGPDEALRRLAGALSSEWRD